MIVVARARERVCAVLKGAHRHSGTSDRQSFGTSDWMSSVAVPVSKAHSLSVPAAVSRFEGSPSSRSWLPALTLPTPRGLGRGLKDVFTPLGLARRQR